MTDGTEGNHNHECSLALALCTTHSARLYLTSVFGVTACVLWARTGLLSVMLVPLTGPGRQHPRTLQRAHIAAVFLSPGERGAVWAHVMRLIRERRLCALIVSPESLVLNRHLVAVLNGAGLALVAFDEAHVWSEWRSWRPTLTFSARTLQCSRRLGL